MFTPPALVQPVWLGGSNPNFNLPTYTWTPTSSTVNMVIDSAIPDPGFLSFNTLFTVATVNFTTATRGRYPIQLNYRDKDHSNEARGYPFTLLLHRCDQATIVPKPTFTPKYQITAGGTPEDFFL
jgi:hypothetical protein